jgi:hypothetical protein
MTILSEFASKFKQYWSEANPENTFLNDCQMFGGAFDSFDSTPQKSTSAS